MRKFINSIINKLSTILTTIFGILVLFGFAGIVLLIAFPIYGISKFVVLVLSIQPICSWLTMEIANGIPIGSIIWFILCFVFSLFCLYLTVKDDFFGCSLHLTIEDLLLQLLMKINIVIVVFMMVVAIGEVGMMHIKMHKVIGEIPVLLS